MNRNLGQFLLTLTFGVCVLLVTEPNTYTPDPGDGEAEGEPREEQSQAAAMWAGGEPACSQLCM